MKSYANKHRIEVIFQLGDLVHDKLQPYRQLLVSPNKTHELSKIYYGPFEVLGRLELVLTS